MRRELAPGKVAFLCRAAAIETVVAAVAPTMSFGELLSESVNIAKCQISRKLAARRRILLRSGARSSTSTNASALAKMRIDAKEVILVTTNR